MSKLTDILAQLKGATNELTGRIATLDEQVSALDTQINALMFSNVSKADFVEYLRADFKKKSARFVQQMLNNLEGRRKYAQLEREFNDKDGFLGGYFLTGTPIPVPLSEEAAYFYFDDLIADKLSTLLDSLDWDNDAVPVELRRTQIETLERDKAELLRQRAELVEALAGAGRGHPSVTGCQGGLVSSTATRNDGNDQD